MDLGRFSPGGSLHLRLCDVPSRTPLMINANQAKARKNPGTLDFY